MSLKLNGSSSGYVALDAPATAGSNTLTLPTSNGSANQFLVNGSSAGSLDWKNNPGIRISDTWRLTTLFRGDVNPIVNWERTDTTGQANILDGTSGMSESSGLFTFPTTGIWEIIVSYQMQSASGQSDDWVGMHSYFSTNSGTNWTAMDYSYISCAVGSAYQRGFNSFTVDVTNSTNCRLKFVSFMEASSTSTGSYIMGSSTVNSTWARFNRIGDT